MKTRPAQARLLWLFLSLLALLAPSAAWAEVTIGFYSRDFGANNFPHAFVRVEGTLEDGTDVESSYGFTARTVSPAILTGSVGGKIMHEPDGYVARSDRHFTLHLSDAEYRDVIAVVERWRTRTQPSYNLNRANCIHFVADVAKALGLAADVPKALAKKPRSFLLSVKTQNEAQIARRSVALQPAAAAR